MLLLSIVTSYLCMLLLLLLLLALRMNQVINGGNGEARYGRKRFRSHRNEGPSLSTTLEKQVCVSFDLALWWWLSCYMWFLSQTQISNFHISVVSRMERPMQLL